MLTIRHCKKEKPPSRRARFPPAPNLSKILPLSSIVRLQFILRETLLPLPTNPIGHHDDNHASCLKGMRWRLTCLKPPENKVLGVGRDEKFSCFKTGLVGRLGLSELRGCRISGALIFWKRKHKINKIVCTPNLILLKCGNFSQYSLHLLPDGANMQTSRCE